MKRIKSNLDDFVYNAQKDQYICPQGKVLKLETRRLKSTDKWYHLYRINDDSCVACAIRNKCMSNKKARQRCICVPGEPLARDLTPSQKMQIKIDSSLGREIYGGRIGNVEPVFGNIRYNKGLDRFTYRGKVKVNVQWLLYCLVHNIEKIAHFGIACPPTGGAR